MRCKQKQKISAQKHRRHWRQIGIDALGGCCSRCGFDDVRALEFDHKTAVLRKSSGVGLKDSIVEIRRTCLDGTVTDVFQLLCANCHAIKTRECEEWLLRHSSAKTKKCPIDVQLSLWC
ncbi:MAG: hypothetical protein IPM06_20620 [Rhizobiales bacterium]|nr:hypothetical protein [Hyphomicrobiales bacterium]